MHERVFKIENTFYTENTFYDKRHCHTRGAHDRGMGVRGKCSHDCLPMLANSVCHCLNLLVVGLCAVEGGGRARGGVGGAHFNTVVGLHCMLFELCTHNLRTNIENKFYT
jgi:hypothetical protein